MEGRNILSDERKAGVKRREEGEKEIRRENEKREKRRRG